MSNEEDAVLATLQASLRNQSAYEEEVIQEATHALAPSLPSTGVGLPSLEGLGTAGVLPAALVHEVLGNVRRQQRESTANDNRAAMDLLCFKEQMLLEYLEKNCGVRDNTITNTEYNGGPSIQEQRRQERRKQQYQKAPPQSSSSLSLLSKKRKATAPVNNVEDTAAIPRRAVKRRKVQQIDNDEDDPLQFTAKQIQEISERRLARQKRKEARRQARLGAADAGPEDDNEEAETELVLDNDGNVGDDNQQQQEQSSAGNNARIKAEAAAEEQPKIVDPGTTVKDVVACPLCGTVLEQTSLDSVEQDALLAQHMQECQSSGRRSSRRSTRTSAAAATAAIAVQQRQDDDVEFAVPPRLQTSTHGRRKKITAGAKASTPPPPPVDDWEEWAYEDRVDDWIANGLPRMKEMKERIVDTEEDIGDDGPWQEFGPGFFVPAWIHRRLFGYQREGLQWMWGLHQQGCGGCLGDEMGLGKTVSIASYLGSLISNRKIKSVLIVVPATMLSHWLKELAVWAPGLRRILIHTSGEGDGRTRTVSAQLLKYLSTWLKQTRRDRMYEAIDAQDEESNPPHSFCGTGYAVLTTYENVRRNPDIYVAHTWSYVILDEAQKIRNPEADVTMTMKRLRTPHRICMTGTPIQNDFSELWSIFDFCFPSRLGTLPAFQQELADPIKRGGYSNATPMQVQLAYRCALVVRDLISPYMLRRQKKDVKEVAMMPAKTEHVLFCRLSETQRTLYEAFLRSDDVVKVMRGSANLLAAITTLRKICNHPDLICDPSSVDTLVNNGFNLTAMNYQYESDSEEDDLDYNGDESMMERSGKLEVLSKILPLWKKQGHRVLIFCQWRKMLNVIERFVNLKNWKFGRIDGNTNVAARQRLVDTFNEDESYFGLLCTTRTGGVGLNLTGANRIILYDPDWNPQTDAQARERAWRFGQEKEVTIYRLITAGSVEEKIYHRQIFKTALSNRVLQDPRQRRLFSQRDLRDLFTLKADTGSVRGGGDGATDTATFTRGIGVVDPAADLSNDEDGRNDEANNDNEDTLKSVMKSKGLAGVFDHHFVEHDVSRKSTTVREMEAKAKEVARAAMTALRHSVADEGDTTAIAVAEPQRFGASLPNAGASSSKSLLAGLKKQKAAASGSREADDETKKYAKLLKTLKEFVRRRRPNTDEILSEFEGSVLSEDAAIFRRLLKSVAVVQNGRWYLK